MAFKAEVFAGDGTQATVDDVGLAASFSRPLGIEFIDPYLYVVENNSIGAFRRIHIETRQVETLSNLGNRPHHLKRHGSNLVTILGPNDNVGKPGAVINPATGTHTVVAFPPNPRIHHGMAASETYFFLTLSNANQLSSVIGIRDLDGTNEDWLVDRGNFHKLRDILVASDGRLYFVGSDFGSRGLNRINTDGTGAANIVPVGSLDTGHGRCFGLCEAPDGHIYWTRGNQVNRWHITDETNQNITSDIVGLPSGFQPTGIVWAEGSVYVCDSHIRAITGGAGNTNQYPTPANNLIVKIVIVPDVIPPLRIHQRDDDLRTGSPRIRRGPNAPTSRQRSARIPGPNAYT